MALRSERREDKERRRARIVAAAAELFAKRGYAATGMDAVGAAAGMTGGGVYRHFDGKLELFRAVVEPMVRRRMARIAEIATEAKSPREAIELLVDNIIDAILEDRSMSATLFRELRHLEIEGREWFEGIRDILDREFGDRLREIRPDLSRGEVEMRIQAFLGVAFSAAEFENPLSRDDLRRLVHEAGLAVLFCRDPSSDRRE
jgi:AcrR family transcriptional regulator